MIEYEYGIRARNYGFRTYKAHTRQSSVRGLKDQRLERASNKGARGWKGGGGEGEAHGKSVGKDMSSRGTAVPRSRPLLIGLNRAPNS